MPMSSELTRFFADHAAAESQVAFARGVDGAPSAANLAASIRAKGYQVGDAEVATVLQAAEQLALEDRQLEAVVGGQGSFAQSITQTEQELAKSIASGGQGAAPPQGSLAAGAAEAISQQMQQVVSVETGIAKQLGQMMKEVAKNINS